MLVCNCTLAGTQACRNCPNYKKYFAQQTDSTSNVELDRQWLKEEIKKAIAEIIEKELADMRGEE